MQAIVWTKFGPPEVLKLMDVPKPIPKANEVLIRVRAATVTAGDCELRGLHTSSMLRLPFWVYLKFFRPRPVILGQELAGQIEAVGNDVTAFKPGDDVFGPLGLSLGAYAEYKVMPAAPGMMDGALAPMPANLSYAEAAAVPIGGLEALHFVRLAQLRPGQRMLIYGAGGSIGTMAVQLARREGAEVTAVDSGEKLDFLRALGASHAIDYRQEDFTRGGQTYDVILDVIGKSHFERSVACLTPAGRYLLGNPSQTDRLRAGRASRPGGRQVIHGAGDQSAARLRQLKELIEAGELKVAVDRQYPLAQTAEAHRYAESGKKKGNVVINVG